MNKELLKRIQKSARKYMGMPVAISGGVDSGLLAALVKPRFVVSVASPGGEIYDESEYAKMISEHLGLEHRIVMPDATKFDEHTALAVKAIGRPIPHFNIFPLYEMYRSLAAWGVKDVVLGDGPDETMCGYARDLILRYLYKVYDFEAFENYRPMIDKILPPLNEALERVTGKPVAPCLNDIHSIVATDIDMMRPDMDDMSNRIAAIFGITNHRPYQDDTELDNFMRNLPEVEKIRGEFGKYALREIAAKYLPKEIAWRKKKVGGPIYPVNQIKGWDATEGNFGKGKWLQYQQSILDA